MNALEMLRESRARLLRALEAHEDGDLELALLILQDLHVDLQRWTDDGKPGWQA